MRYACLPVGGAIPIRMALFTAVPKENPQMAMNLLRRLAASRLPVTLVDRVEVDQTKILRAAGLVIAITSSDALPQESCGAQVLAVTRKGLEELAAFSYPTGRQRTGRAPRSALKVSLFGTLDRMGDRYTLLRSSSRRFVADGPGSG